MPTQSSDIAKIKTRSGLEVYINQNRALCIGMSDNYHEAAERLKLLANNYLRAHLGYVSATYKINRMVRPLNHAADLCEDAAKAFGVTLQMYNGLFIPRQTSTSGEQIDPDA